MINNIFKERKESEFEKKYNFITHFFGLILSLIGVSILIYNSLDFDNFSIKNLICSLVYGSSLIFMYLSSSLYHYLIDTRYSNVLQKLDHVSIYFLIAGSYTPPIVIYLNTGVGENILLIIWLMAIIGTLHKIFFFNLYKNLSLVFYLIMGWLIIIEFQNILIYFSEYQVNLMVLGGLLYTFGAAFYSFNNLKYNHVIWHIFVLLASASHFLLMMSIV